MSFTSSLCIPCLLQHLSEATASITASTYHSCLVASLFKQRWISFNPAAGLRIRRFSGVKLLVGIRIGEFITGRLDSITSQRAVTGNISFLATDTSVFRDPAAPLLFAIHL
mmetsp:Transcript_11067/g.16108  ORF Transcript_11067/g.16108 Transcript_11067/m.16108 type:complete len:111 (+) Transcript_11067:123-455(+)